MIREARLLAGLSQGELGARVGKDRAQIARWERGAVEPSFETLRQLVRACGFELNVSIGPAEVDEAAEKVLRREAPPVAAGALPGASEGLSEVSPDRSSEPFDPRALLGVLDRHHVAFIVIGGLARVIEGADEVTRGVDSRRRRNPRTSGVSPTRSTSWAWGRRTSTPKSRRR